MAGSDSSSIENGGGIGIPAGPYYSHDTPYLTPVGSEKGRLCPRGGVCIRMATISKCVVCRISTILYASHCYCTLVLLLKFVN